MSATFLSGKLDTRPSVRGRVPERHVQPGPVKIPQTLKFGEGFEFDPRAYELRRAGRPLKLERIPMQVLLFLIERRNELVTREQIVERVWGTGVFLDTDNSINGAIRKIRQALRDDSDKPRFVQTVVGQGYRFVAPVTEEPISSPTVTQPQEPPAPVEPTTTSSDDAVDLHPRRRPGPRLLVSLVVLIALTAIASWLAWSRFRAAHPGRVMLAVLPFDNLTGDAGQEYFSDGLTEEMITQLGNLDPARLGVIARTSVMHYKTHPAPLDQVARELGVEYVLEGSLRRDANKVRVTAQLIQTKDQSHVWARQYDRELNGWLALQAEIAQEVADEIQLALNEHKSLSTRMPVVARNYEAYDLYLKGQYFLNSRSPAGLVQAVSYFEQAVAKDPTNPRAYAGLADSYTLSGAYSPKGQSEFVPKARAAALRALQLDDHLPEAHAALGLIVENYDWDWETAEKEFRRATELNPNYATAHHWYAEHLMWLGRFDEALRESERARELDPLSLIIAADNGAILYFSGNYDRAIEKWRSVIEMEPDFPRAHLIVGAFTENGRYAEALAEDERFRPKNNVPSYLSWEAYIYGRSGQKDQALKALKELLQWKRNHPVDSSLLAWAYIGIGDKSQALDWLEKACTEHSTELVSLKVNPGFAPLRSDPRFKELVRRVRFAPEDRR